jgi:cytochrome c biogenesis protein CcmG/thiol:disulfide interchange protein DsbE
VTESHSPLRLAGRVLAITAAVAFVALLIYGVTTKSADTTIDDSLSKAKPVAAPTFDLAVLEHGTPRPAARALGSALADGRLSLRELRGTPVVLNFWASWCVPCRDETPGLQRTWAATSKQNVAIVGLNMQDLSEDARAFSREFRVSYPNIRDQRDDIARKYGTTGVPETFFIDPRGRIVGHVIGVVSPAQLRDGIAAAAAGHVLGAEAGGAQGTQRSPTS